MKKLLLLGSGCAIPLVFFFGLFLLAALSAIGSGASPSDPGEPTGPVPPPSSGPPPFLVEGPLKWPTDGAVIACYFGPRQNPTGEGTEFHWGLDIAEPMGNSVRAAHDGRVQLAGWSGNYGNLIILVRADGFATRYGHLSAFVVRQGQDVRAGEVIGRVGTTGRSTGPHLHFETRPHGDDPVNPLQYYGGA